jgi:hypothetical protein
MHGFARDLARLRVSGVAWLGIRELGAFAPGRV